MLPVDSGHPLCGLSSQQRLPPDIAGKCAKTAWISQSLLCREPRPAPNHTLSMDHPVGRRADAGLGCIMDVTLEHHCGYVYGE
jgi:hypothetical protein